MESTFIFAQSYVIDVIDAKAVLRKTALASITSITYDCENMNVLSITYVDPAARVQQNVWNNKQQT